MDLRWRLKVINLSVVSIVNIPNINRKIWKPDHLNPAFKYNVNIVCFAVNPQQAD